MPVKIDHSISHLISFLGPQGSPEGDIKMKRVEKGRYECRNTDLVDESITLSGYWTWIRSKLKMSERIAKIMMMMR
jgi:hypothetical protein